MPRRSRRVKGTDLTTYNLEQVPRALIAAAREKCRAEKTTLRVKLQALIAAWLQEDAGRSTIGVALLLVATWAIVAVLVWQGLAALYDAAVYGGF